MSIQFTKEFKEDAVRYYLEHKDLGLTVCEKNLGTSRTALCTWAKMQNLIMWKYLQEDRVIIRVKKLKRMQDYVKN